MKIQFLPSVLAISVMATFSSSVHAIKLKTGEKELGDLTGKVQIHTIQGDAGNGYDPSDGDSYLFKLKYVSPGFKGFKIGLASYTNGNLFGSTDFPPPALAAGERLARGMFVTSDGASKTLLGEAYLSYQGEKFSAIAGNQMFKSPLTKIAYSQMPNFYTMFGAETTAIKDFKLSLHQITEMAWGSRAQTDWALIGEGTNSAGTAVNTLDTAGLGQAKFHGIDDISGVSDSDGITVFNANYKGFKGLKLDFWNYYVDEVANNIYIQADKVFPVKDYKLAVSGQYLHQKDAGDFSSNLDFDLFGLKATLKGKGWAVYGAYNRSGGDTAMYNAWGGDPAYTSSIFSRNAYREDVDAFKIGFKYQIMKGLTFMASYADYGQSNTVTSDSGPAGIPLVGGCPGGSDGPACSPANDATETDLVLVYKPNKDWMVKAFYADRTSEYNDVHPVELKQEHFRIIASYQF